MKFLNAHVITPKQPNCYLLDDKFQDNLDKRLAKKHDFGAKIQIVNKLLTIS